MARPLRIQFDGALYHVMNRGLDRRRLFRTERDCERFQSNLEESIERHRVELSAYALLDNHYHLLVRTPHANLAAFMQGLQTRYAVYFNRKYRKSGHVFQGPYTAVLVEEDEYLLKLSRYVHLNPVRTKAYEDKPHLEVVKKLRAYRWSSYCGYVGREKRKDWVDYRLLEGQVEGRFGKKPGVYRRYVEAGLKKEDEEVKELLVTRPLAWGGERFVQDIADRYQALLKQSPRKKEDTVSIRIGGSLSPETVSKELCRGLKITEADLLQRRGGGRHRGLVALLLLKHVGLTQREVAQHLGVATGAAVSLAVKGASLRLAEDRSLRRKFALVEARLEKLRSKQVG